MGSFRPHLYTRAEGGSWGRRSHSLIVAEVRSYTAGDVTVASTLSRFALRAMSFGVNLEKIQTRKTYWFDFWSSHWGPPHPPFCQNF